MYVTLGVITLVIVLGLSAMGLPVFDEDAGEDANAPVEILLVSETSGTRENPHLPYTAYFNQTFSIGSGWKWYDMRAVVWVQPSNHKSGSPINTAEVEQAHIDFLNGNVTGTGNNRTVLSELVTGTWCGFCPAADGAFNRIINDPAYYPEKSVMIEWHGSSSTYTVADSTARINKYGVGGYPTAIFDGVLSDVGGGTDPDDTAKDAGYKSKINSRSSKATTIEITTFGDVTSNGGWINASVYTESEPKNGLVVYIALVEDNLSYVHGSDTVPLRNTGRKMLLNGGPFQLPNDEPLCTLLEDYDGETLSGDVEITWTASDTEDVDSELPITLYYSANKGATYDTIVSNTENDGSYMWDTLGLEDTEEGRLKVSVTDSGSKTAVDIGLGWFELDNPNAPIVDLLTPVPGTTYETEIEVTWDAEDDEDGPAVDVDLYYSDASEVWEDLSMGEDNDGSYTWDVSGLDDGQYKVRVVGTDGDDMVGEALNPAFFYIDNPEYPIAEITYPVGGVWLSGLKEVTWTSSDPEDSPGALTVDLELSGDGGTTWETLVEDMDNDGDWNFDTLTVADGKYKLRLTVTDTDGMSFSAESGAFNVYNPDAPDITSETLNEEVWTGTKEITWTATDPDDGETLAIDFFWSYDDRLWSALAEDEENDGSLTLDTLGMEDGSYYFKLVATDDSDDMLTATYKSPGRITIYNPDAPTVELTSPEGGEVWSGVAVFAWETDDPDNDDVEVTLQYSTDKVVWTDLELGPDDYETFMWDTKTVEDGDYYFRILAEDSSPEELEAEHALTLPVTIDNPDMPTGYFIAPMEDDVLTGMALVEWYSEDADAGDVLTVDLYYRAADKDKRKSLDKGMGAVDEYDWDTNKVANGEYQLIMVVKDGTGMSATVESESFTVENEVDEEPLDGGDGDGATGGDPSDLGGSSGDGGNTGMLVAIIAAVVAAVVVALVVVLMLTKKKTPAQQPPLFPAGQQLPPQQQQGQAIYAQQQPQAYQAEYAGPNTGFGGQPPQGGPAPGGLTGQPGAAPGTQLGGNGDIPLLPPPSN